MKKILIVTDDWHPRISGLVRVLDAHISLLEAQGFDVMVVHPGLFTTVPLPTYPDISLALFPHRKIKKILGEYAPDAVHITTEGPLGWAARGVCVRAGIPFTTWYHTHFDLYIDVRIPGLLRIVNAALRHFHKAAARTLVSTPSLKERLEGSGYKSLAVVPLGVDVERFTHVQKTSLPTLPKPVFVYFGRLAPEKSPEEFLKLKLLGTKLVIGDGPDKKRLTRKYATDAMFVGYKTGQDLVNWLSLADVFVFPSRTETFGLVTLEAMSCGIPVAAHDVMGPRDIITEGKDGYLSEDLAEAAKKCLTLSPTDCRAKALQYSWAHSTEEFVKNLEFIK